MILLHGSGDSGKGLQRYLDYVDGGSFLQGLADRRFATYFPDSGVRPYRLAGGLPMAIWYDRTGLPPSSPEDTASVEASVAKLMQLVSEVRASGVPPRKIAVGGFSMGGGIALQLALRHPESVGAVFALSSYMCEDAAAYRIVEGSRRDSWPPVFMAHGRADGFIRISWAEATARRLRGLGVPVELLALPGLGHELSAEELRSLGQWLGEQLRAAEPAGV